MDSIIASAITGILALIGVVITNMTSNKKMENQLIVSQAVTDQKIETLTNEVRKHNSYITRVPVIEEQIKSMNHRITDLEQHLKKEEK